MIVFIAKELMQHLQMFVVLYYMFMQNIRIMLSNPLRLKTDFNVLKNIVGYN